METKHVFNQEYEDPSINHISEPRMNESLMTIGWMNDYAVKPPMTVSNSRYTDSDSDTTDMTMTMR